MLQETWLTDPPNIKGYTRHHIPAIPPTARQSNGRHHHTIVADHIHYTKIPAPAANCQANALRVWLKLADYMVDTYNIYNRPNTPYSLTPILRLHGTTAAHQIIMGDFKNPPLHLGTQQHRHQVGMHPLRRDP